MCSTPSFVCSRDRPRALVRAEPRVVVDGVVGEVRGDRVGVAGVQRLVVGADVVEAARPLARARTSGRSRRA